MGDVWMCLDYAACIRAGQIDLVHSALNKMEMYDMLSALATISKKDRAQLKPATVLFTPASGADLNRIAFALSVVEQRNLLGASANPPAPNDAARATKWLQDLKIKQLYYIGKDFTDQLPTPNPGAPRLSVADYETAAKELDVEVAAIHAVAEVEVGGRSGFDEAGRPKILFEGHIFHKYTSGKYSVSHPHLSFAKWSKAYYGWDQWTRMYEAMDLDCETAWKSASWGMFQVMGFNHNGWTTVGAFVQAMFVSEYQHLKSFMAYSKDNGLVTAIKKKDWASFASAYNGKEYAQNAYDTKMEAAYKRYAGQSK